MYHPRSQGVLGVVLGWKPEPVAAVWVESSPFPGQRPKWSSPPNINTWKKFAGKEIPHVDRKYPPSPFHRLSKYTAQTPACLPRRIGSSLITGETALAPPPPPPVEYSRMRLNAPKIGIYPARVIDAKH